MNRIISYTRILFPFVFLLYRVVLLNLIIISLVTVIGFCKNIIEQTNSFLVLIPFQLYVITLFLANFVYFIGIIFEIFYLKLWNRQIHLKDFEYKFFKASIIIVFIVNSAGILIYLINYLK